MLYGKENRDEAEYLEPILVQKVNKLICQNIN